MERRQTNISAFRATQSMYTKTFEVYHYRDPYFKSLDFHSHDFFEIYVFLDGNVTYYIEESAYDLAAGDILIIPPGRMHRPVIGDGKNVYERIVLWLDAFFLQSLGLDSAQAAPLYSAEESRDYLVRLDGRDFAFVTELLSRMGDFADQEGGSASRSAIVLLLSILGGRMQTAPPRADHEQELIPQVIAYINAHLWDDLSLDALCAKFYISKFHLIRTFKSYTNATVYDYVIAKRILLAKKLMRQGMTACAAGEQCGFGDYSNFYKAFVKKTGMSPAQFKKTI